MARIVMIPEGTTREVCEFDAQALVAVGQARYPDQVPAEKPPTVTKPDDASKPAPKGKG